MGGMLSGACGTIRMAASLQPSDMMNTARAKAICKETFVHVSRYVKAKQY